MRRKIIECDICGEEVDLWLGLNVFKTTYCRDPYNNNRIERRSRTTYMCTNCTSAIKDLIKERRGV